MSIYLDYNASAPIDPKVLDVMIDVYRNYYGNPDSRTHTEGLAAHEVVESARKQAAKLLGVAPYEVYFTSGATESDNLAILGMAEWGLEHGKNHIITSQIEHKAILEPVRYLQQHGFTADFVAPGADGRVSVEDIVSRINECTLMVCLMHANNETGVIQPVVELGPILREMGVYFMIDAAQTCGKLVSELQSCTYDYLSASAHKFHGPQGIGFLIARRKSYMPPPLRPIMFGGGQENGLRPGTVPAALIAGMGCAAELALTTQSRWLASVQATKALFLEKLRQGGIAYQINGSLDSSMPNTLNVSFDGIDSEALMLALKGRCAFSNGSACTAKNYANSYVLEAMGLPTDQIECAVRISWDLEDISEGIDEIIAMVRMLQGDIS